MDFLNDQQSDRENGQSHFKNYNLTTFYIIMPDPARKWIIYGPRDDIELLLEPAHSCLLVFCTHQRNTTFPTMHCKTIGAQR